MRALMARTHGGPEVLEIADVAPPEPAEDQLLVRVELAGLNFSDIDHRRGERGTPVPMILGTEGSGRVVQTGGLTEGFAVGDRVVWWLPGTPSSCAELAAIPAARAILVPDGFDPKVAVALMLQGITAHALVFPIAGIEPGESVLVHSGAGGVGHLAVQLARLAGAETIIATASPEKFGFLDELGVDCAVDYHSDDWDARVRAASDGGVDVVLDGIGNSTLPGSIASCRRRGRCILYGYKSGGHAGGLAAAFDTGLLGRGTVFLTTGVSFLYVRDRAALTDRVGKLFDLYREGGLKVNIGGVYGLDEAAAAHRALEGGTSRGKLLVELA
ncbi:MAG: zinc-binding dehydrogenase [Chloroflexi bacterium]|nr:zinc-binding dehydrogenase [Chloroflexota bacterium]